MDHRAPTKNAKLSAPKRYLEKNNLKNRRPNIKAGDLRGLQDIFISYFKSCSLYFSHVLKYKIKMFSWLNISKLFLEYWSFCEYRKKYTNIHVQNLVYDFRVSYKPHQRPCGCYKVSCTQVKNPGLKQYTYIYIFSF